jgi:hypothetical protein
MVFILIQSFVMVLNEGKRKMASVVPYEFVYGIYQGVLYLQKAKPLRGTRVKLIPRTSLPLIRSKLV